MRRLGTRIGGKRGGRAMEKIFGKPGAVKNVGKITSRGAGKGLVKGSTKVFSDGATKGTKGVRGASQLGSKIASSPLGRHAIKAGKTIGPAVVKAGHVLAKAAGPIARGASAVSKGAAVAGAVAGGALRAAGKAALPLAIAMTAFDAYSGWNNAAAIHGKDPSQVTTGDKFQAAGAKALEGLTFGLIDAKTGIKWANKAADWMTGHKEQELGNFQNSEVAKYAKQRIEQKKQIQDQMNNAKQALAESINSEVADSDEQDSSISQMMTDIASSGDANDAVSNIEKHLFNTASRIANDNEY